MTGAGQDPQGVLRFERAGRRLAVAARALRGVVALPEVTRVPGAPPVVLGLLGTRGAVLPLVDLEQLARGSDAADAAGHRAGDGAPGEWVWTERPTAGVVVASDAGAFVLAADRVEGFASDAAGCALVEPDEVYRQARAAVRRAAGGRASEH